MGFDGSTVELIGLGETGWMGVKRHELSHGPRSRCVNTWPFLSIIQMAVRD